MKPRTSTSPERNWLQRVRTSVHLAQQLRVNGAPLLAGQLHGYESLHDVPPEVIEQTRTVLFAAERLVRSDRPRWAVAIREELSHLGSKEEPDVPAAG